MFIEKIFSLGIFFGLIPMIGWGTADIFVALTSRKIGEVKTAIYVYSISGIIQLAYVLFAHIDITFSLKSFLLTTIAGLLHAAAVLSFYKGLKIGKVSLVSPISASYSIFFLPAGILFYGEKITQLQFIALTAIILGTFIVSTSFKDLTQFLRLRYLDPGIPYAFFTMVSWGLSFIILNEAIKEVGWFGPGILVSILVVVSLLIYSLFTKKQEGKKVKEYSISTVLLTGILTAAGYIGYGLGVYKYQTSLVGPISAAYPTVTVILALIFLKEKIKLTQLIGIISITVGIVILAI